MSSSKCADVAISPAVRELLQKVIQEGSLDSLVRTLTSPETDDFELIPVHDGAMSDASKRRASDDLDHLRRVAATLPRDDEQLPPGVLSFAMWGNTLIISGKYAKKDLSYVELAQAIDPEKISYCGWMRSQAGRSDLTAPIRDLVDYLVLFQKKKSIGSVTFFPGSNIARIIKE